MDMAFESVLAAGLVFFIIGVAFLLDRINFIKKGNRTIATVIKLEEHLDSDNDKFYTPYFKFTTYNNKQITYIHSSTQSKSKWVLGENVKVAYKEGYLYDHDVLLLTFDNAFGLATLLLTMGIVLLVAAGGIFWNASGKTCWYLIPIAIILPVMAVNIWSNRFFNTLE
jgi:hypothetical protein